MGWLPLAAGEAPAWLAELAGLSVGAAVVGCCDSSPNRHGQRHWEEAGHAIIRSAEPGEIWRHCFPDDLRLEPVGLPA